MLFIIASAAFWLWIVRNVLFWTALWQVKEYRLDRLLVHFKETSQGKAIIFSQLSWIKWLLIIAYVPLSLYEFPFVLYQLLVAALYVYEGWNVSKELMVSFLRRPRFTPKSVFIIVMTFLILMTLYTLPILEDFLWLLLLDKLVAIVVSIFVFSLAFPTEIYQDIQIEKATKKLEAISKNGKRKNPLLVIGVTGSYGKTSTKEYIRQVVKFSGKNVAYTTGSNNTLIGVAKTILSKVRSNTDIFVVEMGAYKRGEIQQLCQMVKPTIGVLTAVSPQHVSLFGGIENTKKAKYELIEALPADGIALFNGNNDIVYELYKKTRKHKVLYTTFSKKPAKNSDVIIGKNIKTEKEGIHFDVTVQGKRVTLKSELIGIHNVENILPAIYVANLVGMSPAKIKQAVESLQPPAKTMTKYDIVGDITVVDDTFNVSPDSVIAALQYASLYKKKRFLILQPMIELGDIAAQEHVRVATEAAKLCDHILVTNMNFYKQMQKAVKDTKTSCKLVAGDSNKLSSYIQTHAKKGDVLIFEGRETVRVLNKLL